MAATYRLSRRSPRFLYTMLDRGRCSWARDPASRAYFGYLRATLWAFWTVIEMVRIMGKRRACDLLGSGGEGVHVLVAMQLFGDVVDEVEG